MFKNALLATAMMVAASAGAASARPVVQDAMSGPPMAAMSPSEYVKAAGASDLFEIREGQLAATRGRSAQVRSFGQKMVTDHTKSTSMVVAAARASGMSPGRPALTVEQQQMYAQLRSATPGDFDRMYLQQQMRSHELALGVQQSYVQKGTDPRLKQAASSIVPVVQSHIAMLQQMHAGA